MHELGIAANIIEIAINSIPADLNNRSVEKINLKLGKLSSVVAESLKFCFETLIPGTRLEGAELSIEEVPVTAKCKKCNFKWIVFEPVFICKKCESGFIDIISGRELDISSIEIADN
ncbi:MAG: hydrogenase maturation nickel metallochaperone HypA [Deltaproteobacteria bacterium]|nr:hydrogenase maturation nickel metallochaperone HypA [Deltaproteobacteria bacterium]